MVCSHLLSGQVAATLSDVLLGHLAGESLYKEIKRVTDSNLGIPSQCMVAQTFFKEVCPDLKLLHGSADLCCLENSTPSDLDFIPKLSDIPSLERMKGCMSPTTFSQCPCSFVPSTCRMRRVYRAAC
jgi:hypothetical protein